MDESLESIESEIIELEDQEARIDSQLAAGCEQLLAEFRRRYPLLKRVPELVLQPNTLQNWIEKHRGQRP